MKRSILAAIVTATLSLGIAHANAEASSYRAPAHNYYQNNWMGSGH